MTWRLSDVIVPKQAYEDAYAIIKRGGKAHLLRDECWSNYDHSMAYLCPNCRGIGELILEVITGGPKEEPIKTNPAKDQKEGRPVNMTTWMDGKWYRRVLHSYVCPPCLGSGRVQKVEVEEGEKAPLAF